MGKTNITDGKILGEIAHGKLGLKVGAIDSELSLHLSKTLKQQ